MEQSVYELQQMALDKNVDIEELLRKAYLMAVSTNQKDIEKWILNEQNSRKGIVSYSIADALTQVLNKNGSFVTVYNYFVFIEQLKQVISFIPNKILHRAIELEKIIRQ